MTAMQMTCGQPGLGTLWQDVWEYMTNCEATSIDGVIAHLLDLNTLNSASTSEDSIVNKSLIFAIVGWQTMLYKPDI